MEGKGELLFRVKGLGRKVKGYCRNHGEASGKAKAKGR